MAEAITLFKTADGKTFENEVEANAHDILLANAQKIETFLDQHFPKVEGVRNGPTRSIAKRAIGLYLRHTV